ncbi:MAG: S-layer family protein [Thioploca sp.]|nr:S-layer family protein [Thioploca sp.]
MRYLVLLLNVSLFTSPLQAQITLDGTLGPKVALEGPDYQIHASLGQQQGSNLFHSFEQFNIDSGQTATFLSGPSSVENVIGRVTGGTLSHINGTLKSDIPNIYLINPAGLLFGPNAKLDVLGSFHAGTADALNFTDGSEFNARNPAESSLTVAPVSAFRFLGESPQPVTIDGSTLNTQAEQTLSLIGGPITIRNGTLESPAGRINLASIAKLGEVALKPQDLVLSAQAGDISLAGTKITVSGSNSDDQPIASGHSGSIYIRGGQFETDSSTKLEAYNTKGNADGGEINAQADDFVHRGSLVSYAKAGTGQSSNINIKVLGSTTLSGIRSILLRSEEDGNVGNINLETGTLRLQDKAYIKTLRTGSGQGSNINIRATEAIILSGTDVSIAAETNSEMENAGSAGIIKLETPQLHLEDGAKIETTTEGKGKAADFKIRADKVTLLSESGIFSTTEGKMENAGSGGTIRLETSQLYLEKNAKIGAVTEGTGKSADIEINANNVTLRDGSQIYAVSNGSGNGGTIVLDAEQLILKGMNTDGKGNRISVSAENEMADAGDGGTMTLTLGRLQLSDGAQIEAVTFGPGQGGQLNITVSKEAIISGQDEHEFHSGLFTSSQSEADNAGDGGYLNFRVGDLHLTDNAEIYARTWGSGQGGNIDINAQTINLASGGRITAYSKAQGDAGQIRLTIRDRLQMRNSQIETSALSADGGNLAITASNYIHLVNSQITTSVSEEFGEGGNIDLNPEFIILNGSEIIAKAKKGKGGDINITTRGIYNFTGEPIEKVINASSEYNEDGIVTINTPDNSGEEGLLVLPSTFVDASALLDTPCSHRIAENMSSFMMVPTEGITNAPNDLLSNPALLLKPSLLNTVAAMKKLETTAATKLPRVALMTVCHSKNSTTQKPQTIKKSYLISEQLF